MKFDGKTSYRLLKRDLGSMASYVITGPEQVNCNFENQFLATRYSRLGM